MIAIIFIFCFVSITMIVYLLSSVYAGKNDAVVRIKKYTELREMNVDKTMVAKKEYRKGLELIAKYIDKLRVFEGVKDKIRQELSRAHILLKAEEFISICILLTILCFGLLYAITLSILISAFVGLVGGVIPMLFVKARINSRKKAINEQLADTIVLISNSLKAGYSFFQSIDAVCKEMPPPISEEFTGMQNKISFGTTVEEALEQLVKRVRSDDLDMVVTAVLIQRQVGGNLAEILDNISSTIRDRIKIKSDIRAITAQGRISGLIISVLPVGLGAILYFINPEHIGLLFTETAGIFVLVFSALMQLIGVYFINKIVKIDI